MIVELEADDVSVDEVQTALHAVWAAVASDPASRSQAAEILGTNELPEAIPLTAKPGEDNYGIAELILIAAAGRMVGTYTERMLDKLFHDVIWPRLEAKFGEGIRKRDKNSDGD